MAVSHLHCTPYLSATLFRTNGPRPSLTTDLRRAIETALTNDGGNSGPQSKITRTFAKPFPTRLTEGDLEVVWFRYEENRPPAWYNKDELTDTHHHIVVICRKAALLSISFSDNGARNAVMRRISSSGTAPFAHIARLPFREMDVAFVETEIRTFWLTGAHRRTAIKPDAKVLSGLELESALDPLEDQSFYYSSVRSTSGNSNLIVNGRRAVIGVSPRHGRVWIGPSASWSEFTGRMEHILDQAADRTLGPLPDTPTVPILAQPSMSMDDVSAPYDVALIVPEELIAGPAQNGDEERLLQQFGDAARFEIHPVAGGPHFEADIFWGDEELGRLAYQFEPRDDGEVRINVEKKDWKDDNDHQDEIFKICRDAGNLTVYFDTGHTFSRGQIYQTQFRDMPFQDWRWVNMDGVAVEDEKPLDGKRFAVERVGDDDTSLFGLVVRHWPFLEDRGQQTGWLVCDDGSMESADFIYFEDRSDPPQLSLIHVKGSGTKEESRANRRLSVTDYEVVTGQAVKNLRHIDRGRLIEKLEANKHTTLRDAVWHDGVRQDDREGVLAALNAAGSNMKKNVIVLQPRVRKAEYDNVRSAIAAGGMNKNVLILKQLDTLLLAARAECFGLGATFEVIADDDG